MKNFKGKLTELDWRPAAIALITKFLILFLSFQAYQVIVNTPTNSWSDFLGIWKRWDAVHYLDIAQYGYTTEGDRKFDLAFFPFYPLLVGIVGYVIGNYVISGLVVSGIFSIVAAYFLKKITLLDYSAETALTAVFFLFIFPTSYFLHLPYTESLFLALTIGAFYFARKSSWLWAGIFGLFASVTRINGMFLVPALLFEIFYEYQAAKSFNRKWLWVLLIPLGFLGYLFINYYVTGNAFTFLTYQKEHWAKNLDFPWKGIVETFKSLVYRSPNDSMMVGFQELLFAGIGFLATVFSWFKQRKSYSLWMTLNWLLFVSTSFILSVPRYSLMLFPMFIAFAFLSEKNHSLKILITVWSIVYLGLFTAFFASGRWAF
jgi:Gpi18-like mannosyltransferase